MPPPAMPGSAKTHPLEQMDENMSGPLPRRDLQSKPLDLKKKKKSYLEKVTNLKFLSQSDRP